MQNHTQILAWQGLSLAVPATWNPVKIGGDYDQGSLLLADLSSSRLGLRWRRASRADPAAWADRALRDELGALAASEAVDVAMVSRDAWKIARIYIDRDPPGRDVFVGWSERSGRVIEIVYNAPTHDDVLARAILPSLVDTPAAAEHTWSIFGLHFSTPSDCALQSYALNAGDVALTFVLKGSQTTIRRVGPASLALSRRPLEKWVTALPKSLAKMYRAPATASPTTLNVAARVLPGLAATIRRRRRLCWAWFVPKQLTALAIRDDTNDRLLLGCSANEFLLRQILSDLAGNLLPLPSQAVSTGGAGGEVLWPADLHDIQRTPHPNPLPPGERGPEANALT